MNNPKVSVFMMAYNHEKYISQAIDSVLMQKVDFGFEIIIGEDCSSDNTRSILLSYKEKEPQIFKLLLHKRNIGAMKNQNQVFRNCSGKYIALIEGDDYWTDPDKLQKQFDFLEANEQYGMVCTNYNRFVQKTQEFISTSGMQNYQKEISYDNYLLDRSTIGTATVMIRKDIVNNYIDLFKDKMYDWDVGDTPLYLYTALNHQIKYLNDITAVYRINENSASKFSDLHKKYRFRVNGYKIPFYFIEKFGAKKETIERLNENYHRIHLRYAYEANDYKIAIDSYHYLLENGKLNPEDKLIYQSAKNPSYKKLYNIGLSGLSTVRKIKKRINKAKNV